MPRKTTIAAPAAPARAPALRLNKRTAASTHRTIRETIESIVVAFVLAFLFRTFEAEAFVIPTGSMAPTLQGRHKDVICPECGFSYRVSASSEVDESGADLQFRPDSSHETAVRRERMARDRQVVEGTCPNCRYTMNLDPLTDEGNQWPAYNGDRILVAKFPYDFSDPKRWDVVVFRFPGDAKMNYIKRLVGRPNETVLIRHGDILIQGPDDKQFAIARKPPAKVRAMAQTVYDNDFVVEAMTAEGWPLRWQPWPTGAKSDWSTPDGGRSYEIGAESGESWLRYQHFAPLPENWQDGHLTGVPRARLITDFYAYNTNESRQSHQGAPPLGTHWVGDLMLEATLDVRSATGTVLLDLVKAGRRFTCEIDVSSGAAQLKIDDLPKFQPQAKTGLRGPGRHQVAFSNFDRQLLLWVDGTLATFDEETTYPELGADLPTADDLAPAGIGTRGASLEVQHLVLKRDVYYIAEDGTSRVAGLSDYNVPPDYTWPHLSEFFADPSQWTGDSLFAMRREVAFPLQDDQFFVLGDNSPFSKDGRLWANGGREYYVSRELLIGKALFIYWPHSLNKLPFGDVPFPYFPNFKDMGFVR